MSVEIKLQDRKVIDSGSLVVGPGVKTIEFKTESGKFILHIVGKSEEHLPVFQKGEDEFSNGILQVGNFLVLSMGVNSNKSLTAQMTRAFDDHDNFYIVNYTITEY